MVHAEARNPARHVTPRVPLVRVPPLPLALALPSVAFLRRRAAAIVQTSMHGWGKGGQ